ncbi:ATP-binding protein [Desulfosediminicola sp.]|uniref:ATP-binding protein n=1 Tax=Desulfosediminicola sp. TaxID=2886825 RepID=UPI003AF20B9D
MIRELQASGLGSRKASTLVTLTIIGLVIVSIIAVYGILYFSFAKSLTREFEDRVAAESGKAGLAVDNRLNRVKTRLKALSLDNTVRVTLMLGATKQLDEYLREVYSYDNDLHFVVQDNDGNTYRAFEENYCAVPFKKVFTKPPGSFGIVDILEKGEVLISYHLPVMRQGKKIGAAAAVYHLQRDSFLKNIIQNLKSQQLVMVRDGVVWDALNGEVTDFTVQSMQGAENFIGAHYLDDGDHVAMSISQLPGLFFVSGLEQLEKAKVKVVLSFLLTGIALTIIALLVSRFLSYTLVEPMQKLSSLALKISEGKDAFSEEIGHTGIVEVEQLKDSLNRMVNYLQQARENERYQTLFEGVADMVFIHNLHGELVEFNGVTLKMLGYSRETLLKTNFRELVPESERDSIDETFGQILPLQTELFFTTRLLDRNNLAIDVECHARRIQYIGQEVVLNVVRDISARVRAVKALNESQQRLLTVMDSIHATIYVADLDTHEILFMNRQMKQSYGENLEGRKCYQVTRRLSEPCKHCTSSALRKMHDDGKREIIWEGQNPISNIWYVNYDRIVNWIDGREVKMQISFNITQMKELEIKRAQAEQQLRRSQKMEAIGAVAGGVAHDLNNILTGVVSYPDLLLMDMPEDSPMRSVVMTIRETGLKAAAIVQDLLTLSRRSVVRNKVVNINDIIRNYLNSPEHQNLLQEFSEVRIELDLKPDLLNILGSTVHLAKTVMNLIFNAAEAIEGPGTISISTHMETINGRSLSSTVEPGEYVVLVVSDDGCGIDKDDKERIFEPFFSKKTMGRSGTGLGMAVVWGTVEDHEGHIDLTSTPGDGSTFTLYFPVTRKELLQEQLLVAREEFTGKGETILVVDDLLEQREIVSMMFSQLGYTVKTAGSGEEAIEYLQTSKVDLVMLDMIMENGLNGLETYREILKLHPFQKAIVASGYTETDQVKEVIRLGAGCYIRKPYLFEEIASAVKAELAKESSELLLSSGEVN